MRTRDALVQRADVPDTDIDEIIEIAARLQDEEAAAKPMASVQDVEAVAAELDIDPSYVDAAINTLAERRAAEAAAAEEAAENVAAVTATAGALGLGVVAMGVGGVFLILVVLGGLTLSADSRMDTALAEQQRAEVNLDTVLDRQAALAPQLMALAGGDAKALTDKAETLRNAPDIESKLAASDALGVALANALGGLPPTQSQARDDLRHEIAGTANRINVERRRYEDAKLTYETASTGIGAGMARGLGLH